jgi:hypothetical protein
LQVVGGRTTAWRNIFGTDPDTLAQTLGMARAAFQVNERFELLGRASLIKRQTCASSRLTLPTARRLAEARGSG